MVVLLLPGSGRADVLLRRNGFYIEVEAAAGYEFITGLMERHEFRFGKILDWGRQHTKPRDLRIHRDFTR
jgi:hypothetical protein